MTETRENYQTKPSNAVQIRQYIILTIPGVAMGKQRARTYLRASGNVRTVTPERTRIAEAIIRWHWQQSKQEPFPPNTELRMYIAAYLPRPKSAPMSRQRPITRPDWDNIGKLVSDALNGFAYDDDARIVSATVNKFFAVYPDEPRIVVKIWSGIGAALEHIACRGEAL